MILDILFPRYCVSCRKWGSHICLSCVEKIKALNDEVCVGCNGRSDFGLTHTTCKGKTYLDGVISVWEYNAVMKKIIKSIKYQLAYDVLRELFVQIPLDFDQKFNRFLSLYPAVVLQPVPLYSSKQKKRGFNQSELISNVLKRKYAVSAVNIVKRVRDTKPQAMIRTKKERQKNMENAFAFIDKVKRAKDVIIVDDVFTSGSTANEIARILKAHNVEHVFAFSLAHGSS